MMNSDELGEKGESRFKEICADAGLICNKADRDRAGWDFIVEFPFQSRHETLDQRATPLSCHVQVKTILKGTDSVKMRLSSAERLAKELKPSFIYVLKVDPDSLQFTDAYLIHLLGNRLGAILKRLRSEQAKGTSAADINKKQIAFTPASSERLDPVGGALRGAFQSVASDGLHSYAEAKSRELRTLGFESFEAHVTMTLAAGDDVGDIFLGLRKKVPASSIRAFSNRFGIKLPEFEAINGTITVEPNPADQCSITVRDGSAIPPVGFTGQLFISPVWRHALTSKQARLSSKLFSLEFGSESARFACDTDKSIVETPEVWWRFWRMLLAFASGTGTLRIVSQTRPLDFALSIPPSGNFPAIDECDYWMSICKDLSYLIGEAGAFPEPTFTFGDIASNAKDVRIGATLMNAETFSLSSTLNLDATAEIPDSGRMLVGNVLQIGALCLAFYRVAQSVAIKPVAPSKFELVASDFSKGKVELIKNPTTYEEFIVPLEVREQCNMAFRLDAFALDAG